MNVHIPHFCCSTDLMVPMLYCLIPHNLERWYLVINMFIGLVTLLGKNIDASGSCHHVTMEVKIIVRTILSRAKNLWLKRHTKNYQKSTKIFSSQISKRAVITGVGGTLLFFDHFSCVIVEWEYVKISIEVRRIEVQEENFISWFSLKKTKWAHTVTLMTKTIIKSTNTQYSLWWCYHCLWILAILKIYKSILNIRTIIWSIK